MLVLVIMYFITLFICNYNQNKIQTDLLSKIQTDCIIIIEKIKNEKNNISLVQRNTQIDSVFISSDIPQNIYEKMIGNSIPENSVENVDISKLSYLKIAYWGFDDKSHIGEMIVNKVVAQEVLDIFKEVYEKKYPIEKIKLIDEYGADDEKSMEDNNTSAFCYRKISNTNKLSNHSLGMSIDINPLYNPYVTKNYILPTNANIYFNRNIDVKGIIKKEDDLYNAFIKRGWKWGGEWKNKKDYQHFEKL